MKPVRQALLVVMIATAAIVVSASAVLTQGGHRRAAAPEAWGGWQDEAVRAATERAQNEPGVTRELAPDARQTATGGPSGGVPGFSGH